MSTIGSLSKGINSNIALIEKMEYGYRNKQRLKTAIYFGSGNLQLYP
jgi:transposase